MSEQDIKYKPLRVWNQLAVGKESSSSPDKSAWLDIGKAEGTTKGVLLSRVTDVAVIDEPKESLLAYQLSTGYKYFDGANWQTLATVAGIADSFIQNQNAAIQTADFWVQTGKANSFVATTFFAGSGGTTTPSYTFAGESNTGFFKSAANQIATVIAGGVKFYIQASDARFNVDLLPNLNNTYNLGSSIIKWLNIYASASIQTPLFVANGVVSDPSSPADGSIWYRSDLGRGMLREGGATWRITVDNGLSNTYIPKASSNSGLVNSSIVDDGTRVTIQAAANDYALLVKGGTTAAGLYIGGVIAGYGGFWSSAVTPSATNYALAASATSTAFNGGSLQFNVSNVAKFVLGSSGVFSGQNGFAGFGTTGDTTNAITSAMTYGVASLTGTSIVQRLHDFSGTINQTSTAGYTLIYGNVTETTIGSGARNLLDLNVNAVSKFSVGITGLVRMSDSLNLTGSFIQTHPTFTGGNTISITANNQITFTNYGIGPYLIVGPQNEVNTGSQILLSIIRGAVFGATTIGRPAAITIEALPAQSSGSTTAQSIYIMPIINNTGTYTGTYWGIYYNPTLNSLTGTMHIAYENVTGHNYLNTTSGSTLIGYASGWGTPGTYKLDVSGVSRFLSSTEKPLRIEHSNGNYAEFIVGNGGLLAAGETGYYLNGAALFSANSTAFRVNRSLISTASNTQVLAIRGAFSGTSIGNSLTLGSNVLTSGAPFSATSGTQNNLLIASNESWSPTSGNATWNIVTIDHIINATGTYAGIVRGLYYNPTLTSITGVTHIAWQNSTGNNLFGTTSGSVGIGANTSIAATAILDITSTTKGFLKPRMTTTQVSAISSPAEGLEVYDTTLHAPKVYDSTGWQQILTAKTNMLAGYTVAGLPAGAAGYVAYVTDALTPTSGAAVIGGGAIVAPVFHDGTTWITL